MVHIRDEDRESVARDDRRIRRTQRLYVHLQSETRSRSTGYGGHQEALTISMFSRSRTYCISPLISSKMILQRPASGHRYYYFLIATTHLWRFCSDLVIPALTSSLTKLCHSNLAVGPLHIACWNVCSTHDACRFLNACTASNRKSRSGLPSAVSFAMASSTCSYRCRCSDGRFRNTLSSILRAFGLRFAF